MTKSKEEIGAWGFIVLIGVVICGVITLFGFNWGMRSTGYVDTSDCRATVELKDGDWDTYWHKFYCNDSYCNAVSIGSGKCDINYHFEQSSTKLTNMQPISITRAQYKAKFGVDPNVPSTPADPDTQMPSDEPIRMTRAQYKATYGVDPNVPTPSTTSK